MPAKETQHLHITTGTFLRLLGILLFLALVYTVREVVMALIFAVIIASAMEPAVEWLKQRKIPRLLGVILIYLGITALFFFGIYLVIPLIVDEFRDVSQTLPALQQQALDFLGQANLPFTPFFGERPAELLRTPLEYLQNLSQGVFSFASAIFGGIFSFVLIIVFSFYLLAQEKGIENFLRLVTPLAYEPYILDLWQRSQRKLGQWFRAQMLLGAIVGVLTFFGLTFLGVRHAFIFAVLAAAFEIIPIVGPILAAVPAVLLAFVSSTLLGFLTVALYVVVQQVESNIIVPVVMRKAVGLSPIIVLLSLLVGVKIGGLFGILLAVPLVSILTELINDWDKKKRELIPE